MRRLAVIALMVLNACGVHDPVGPGLICSFKSHGICFVVDGALDVEKVERILDSVQLYAGGRWSFDLEQMMTDDEVVAYVRPGQYAHYEGGSELYIDNEDDCWYTLQRLQHQVLSLHRRQRYPSES